MSAPAIGELKKRGRPSKYGSAKEKKAANAHRRRAQRQGKAAPSQEVQIEAYRAEGPGQSVFFWPTSVHLDSDRPSTLESGVDTGQTSLEGTVQYGNQDFETFLPPLGPSDSPLLDPVSTRIDDALHQYTTANETIASTRGQEEAERESIEIISDETVDVNRHGNEGIAINDEAEQMDELADRLVDQLVQHHGCCEHCHQQSQKSIRKIIQIILVLRNI